MTYGIMARIGVRICMVLGWIITLYAILKAPDIIQTISAERRINILAWPTALSSDYLEAFEKETGIKVSLSYFTNNDELFIKLQSGAGDYDLIMPSDHITPLLIKEGLLKQLDATQLPCMQNVYPALLGHYFDPTNAYTIPYLWGVYGLGINTNIISLEKAQRYGWRLLFDQNVMPQSVGMPDDVREVVNIAAFYLYQSLQPLTTPQIQQVTQLLKVQRNKVSLYSDDRSDYVLLSGMSPIAVAPHYDILRAMKHNQDIAFVLPQEGSFVLIDSCAIPASSKKEQYVYQFLNYLFQPHVMQLYMQKFGFLPPIKGVDVPPGMNEYARPSNELFTRLHFFTPLVSSKDLTTIWINLKA